MGGLRNAYPQLFTLRRFEVAGVAEDEAAGAARVDADVWPAGAAEGAPERFSFFLERCEFGAKKGCWLTKRLLPSGSKWL